MIAELNLSKIKDNSLIEDCPELGFYPSLEDNIEAFNYFISKYHSGMNKPDLRYYLFWGMTDYPPIDKEDIKHATELYFKEKSYFKGKINKAS